MAENDEFDSLVARASEAELESLAEILKVDKTGDWKAEYRNRVNTALRHGAYGHAVANLFRLPVEPDYAEIVRAVAAQRGIKVWESFDVEQIENKILVDVIEEFREHMIKEKGREAWERIEREAEAQLHEEIASGRIPKEVAGELKGVAPGTLMTVFLAGKLGGFATYMFANQLMFFIARQLGLKLTVTVAGVMLGRTLAFLLGPAGWAITVIWVILDVGNTNWARTTAGVVAVTLLRRKIAAESALQMVALGRSNVGS